MADLMQGKVALVTGASSGIGRATALTFARERAKVVVSDVALEGGEETADLIREAGGEALFVSADVSQAAQVEALVAKTVETYGRLDAAHNNAGVEGSSVMTTDYTEADWDQVIAINLTGVWLCMKYQIPHMLTQGGGRDCQYIFSRRAARFPPGLGLCGQQTRRARPDQNRSPGIRQVRYPGECRLPRRD